MSAYNIYHPPLRPARNDAELSQLEATHRVYDLFVWLAFRFEESFSDVEVALDERATCAALIEEGLTALGRAPEPARWASVVLLR